MARVRFRLEGDAGYRLTEELPEWDAELYCASLATGQALTLAPMPGGRVPVWRRADSAFVLRDPPPAWRRVLDAVRRRMN